MREIRIQRRNAGWQFLEQIVTRRRNSLWTDYCEKRLPTPDALDGRHQFDLGAIATSLLQDRPIARLVHAEGFTFHLTGQVERLFGNAMVRQFERIGRHPLLDRGQHLRRCVEEAIRRR